MDTLQSPKCSFFYIVNAFRTSEELTTSLQRTKWLTPTCPLFRGSTVITIVTLQYCYYCLQSTVNYKVIEEVKQKVTRYMKQFFWQVKIMNKLYCLHWYLHNAGNIGILHVQCIIHTRILSVTCIIIIFV